MIVSQATQWTRQYEYELEKILQHLLLFSSFFCTPAIFFYFIDTKAEEYKLYVYLLLHM